MLERYDIGSGYLTPHPEGKISVYSDLTDSEKETLLRRYDIDKHTYHSALDAEEISRLENKDDRLFLVWKYPSSLVLEKRYVFNILSLGVFLIGDELILVSENHLDYLEEISRFRMESLHTVISQLFYASVRHFLDHLKTIRMISREIQDKINKAMGNEYLIKMFNLSELLVQYDYSVDSNKIVLVKFKKLPQVRDSEALENLIDDIIIENEQASRQAEIYTQIFSGLMDARGTIVNNNMNILIKNLTIINIIFLPLNLIASMGGMSEFSMMTKHLDWRISYLLFSLGMIVIGVLTMQFVNRMEKRSTDQSLHLPSRNRKRTK